MRAFPHHGLEKWIIIHSFYNGLLYNIKMTIDVAADRALMNKPFDKAYALIKDIVQNQYLWGSEHTPVEKTESSHPKSKMYEVSNFDHMNAKMDALAQKVDNLSITSSTNVTAITIRCEIIGTLGHATNECQQLPETQDQMNYAQGNPYSNSYNPR